ncbi:hypothetical protein WJX81_003699 [Elliptochloris bilobata]|uniref:Uncharacterized protein n=1 Tax=Elliptochloris bilobata TaxID=381761 RepID=A0AAW1RP10_9CHLO
MGGYPALMLPGERRTSGRPSVEGQRPRLDADDSGEGAVSDDAGDGAGSGSSEQGTLAALAANCSHTTAEAALRNATASFSIAGTLPLRDACWDYQALLIQEALGGHAGTKPGSAEALQQMGEAAVATQLAASNASAPGRPRIAVNPILYPPLLADQNLDVMSTIQAAESFASRKHVGTPVSVNGSQPLQNAATNILYNGGPVMSNGLQIYNIWYGNWNTFSDGTAQFPTTFKVLTDMSKSIGGKPWYKINTGYYMTVNGQKASVKPGATYKGYAAVPNNGLCWQGFALSNDQIFAVIDCLFRQNALPYSNDAVYVFLAASNVNNPGFCTAFCGWHTYGYDSLNRVTRFAFIGSPAICYDKCTAQSGAQGVSSPNNNAEADGMASIIAHELAESVTDPLINAWYNKDGYENADICAWTFGSALYPAGNYKGMANLKWTCKSPCVSRNYLIQQNFVNSGNGFCALHP